MPWIESFAARDKRLRAQIEAEQRAEKQARRAELLRVAAAVVLDRADVIREMAARHPDKENAARDELHALYDQVAAEMAVNRARALIAQVDKDND